MGSPARHLVCRALHRFAPSLGSKVSKIQTSRGWGRWSLGMTFSPHLRKPFLANTTETSSALGSTGHCHDRPCVLEKGAGNSGF